jgi:hypothetical protein
MPETNDAVRQEFRAGRATLERKFAACSGSLPLSPPDRAEVLALLVSDADAAISERSQNAILSVPHAGFVIALGRADVSAKLIEYCSRNISEKSDIADLVAAHPLCSAEDMGRVARHLSVTGLQSLFDNLERLTEHPKFVAALLASAPLSPDQKLQLEELGQGAAGEEALAEAVADAEPDPHKRLSLLQRLATMKVLERMQLALKGGREERMALIRDPCRVVQRGVLQSPRLSEREVESFASMTNLTEEILRIIAQKRNFRKNYKIVRNLVNNSKTPIDVSLNLLGMIQIMDLKMLTLNKNIPDTVRQVALKKFREKSVTR